MNHEFNLAINFTKHNLAYIIVKEIAYHNRLILPWNFS